MRRRSSIGCRPRHRVGDLAFVRFLKPSGKRGSKELARFVGYRTKRVHGDLRWVPVWRRIRSRRR